MHILPSPSYINITLTIWLHFEVIFQLFQHVPWHLHSRLWQWHIWDFDTAAYLTGKSRIHAWLAVPSSTISGRSGSTRPYGSPSECVKFRRPDVIGCLVMGERRETRLLSCADCQLRPVNANVSVSRDSVGGHRTRDARKRNIRRCFVSISEIYVLCLYTNSI